MAVAVDDHDGFPRTLTYSAGARTAALRTGPARTGAHRRDQKENGDGQECGGITAGTVLHPADHPLADQTAELRHDVDESDRGRGADAGGKRVSPLYITPNRFGKARETLIVGQFECLELAGSSFPLSPNWVGEADICTGYLH